jgi:hypothetical protein
MLRNNPFYFSYSKREIRALCVNPHADLSNVHMKKTLKMLPVARLRKHLYAMLKNTDCPFTADIFSKVYNNASLHPDWCKYILTNILGKEEKI